MIRSYFTAIVLIAASAVFVAAQGRSNAELESQLRRLKAEKTISLSFDKNSNVSKIMAVAENFSSQDAKHLEADAMNFAVGFMYSGEKLVKPPESVILTFWIMTAKPKFAVASDLAIDGIKLGSARYVYRKRDKMEYLNYEVPFADLKMIAAGEGRIELNGSRLTFTPAQLSTLRNLVELSDAASR